MCLALKKPKTKRGFIAKLSLMNRGMLVGDEDAIGEQNYSKTARCKSITGTVFAISASNFISLILSSTEIKEQIDLREELKNQGFIK